MSAVSEKINRKITSPLRWFVLILVCTMFIGSYYCLETPAALKTQLKEYMNSPDDYETKFQLMYTLYSAPNIILPIFGGYIIDRFGHASLLVSSLTILYRIGARNSLLLFMSLVLTAQMIFMIGLSQKSWTTILLGRFLFGVGNESFIIANSTILTHWFCGRELALAFGFNTTFARLGSVINNVLSIYLVQHTSLLFSFWFGVMMVMVCLGIVIVTVMLDKWMEIGTSDFIRLNQSSLHGGEGITVNKIHDNGLELVPLESPDAESCEDCVSPRRSVELSDDEWNRLEREDLEARKRLESFSVSSLDDVNSGGGDDGSAGSDVLKDIKSLPLLFWVLILCSSCISASTVCFNSISSSLLLERDYFRDYRSEYPQCRLVSYGCQSETNPQLADVCPSSQWYQPPLPYNVTLFSGSSSSGDGTGGSRHYYQQVEPKDIDCTSPPWRSSGDSVGCTEEYCERIEAAESRASFVMSIPYVLGAALGPVVGYAVDNLGQRVPTALLAGLTAFLSHAFVNAREMDPIVPLVFQGLAVAFISILWSASCLVVPKQSQGLAFGIFGSVLNFFWAATPIAIAAVYNSSNKFYIPNVEYLFMSLSFAGLILGLLMQFLDGKSGGVLNSITSVEMLAV